MRAYEAGTVISATPDRIWSILTDAPGWSTWGSGVDNVDGRIALGETITIQSKVAPGRAFPVKVTTFEPGSKLVFSGGMPLGLFKGVRTYTLARQGDDATRFHMREEYSGPLLGMMWRSMPDLQPSFDTFVTGLKQRAEAA
jgi:uncharacterized protein YndB with AHSA1/START domain